MGKYQVVLTPAIIVVVMFVAVVLIFTFTTITDDDECNVVHMLQWAGETSLRQERLPSPVDLVVIHHTVTSEPTTDGACEIVLREIRTYQVKMAFDDIGYSFLVCGNGKVYEGAGWELVGAHTRGYNRQAIGIAFIGDFRSHQPSSEALTAAQKLMSCGVAVKHLSSQYKVVGLRQLSSTLSPGDSLQKVVETWPHWTDTL